MRGWVNIADIFRANAILCICWVYHFDPVGVHSWWTHSVCMAWPYVLGSVGSYGGIVGSSYVMVSTLKCAITCEYGKGPSWGLRLRYQFSSGVTGGGLFIGNLNDMSGWLWNTTPYIQRRYKEIQIIICTNNRLQHELSLYQRFSI